MSGRDADNVVIAYVRGEPMNNEDRSLLEQHLPNSVILHELVTEQRSLSADLSSVRVSNHKLRPSATVEASLMQAFREQKAGSTERSLSEPIWRNVAGLCVVAIGLVSWGILQRDWHGDAELPISVLETAMAPSAGGTFIQLPYTRAMGATEGFTIVRARLGRMGLLNAGIPLPASYESGSVVADLLLGDDGAMIGIRFVNSGLSTADSMMGLSFQEDRT